MIPQYEIAPSEGFDISKLQYPPGRFLSKAEEGIYEDLRGIPPGAALKIIQREEAFVKEATRRI